VDNFYYRFTTPKANSLILGASRAAQGLKPEIINNKICLDDECNIINHAFAGGPSSIGPNYLKEIKQKLNEDNNNGLFIISAVPWLLCTAVENVNDDSTQFFEVRRKLFVGNLKSSNSNPNFEYLWKYWNNKFSVFETSFKHLINYGGILQLHADGWLEVDIPMDSISVNNRIVSSTNGFRQDAKFIKWSDTRNYYFEEIIRYLSGKGEIYIVRLPVSINMAELEREKFPDFDNRMKSISQKYNIPYINFFEESGEFLTTDTHHLWKEESERITNRICDSILVIRETRISIANNHIKLQ